MFDENAAKDLTLGLFGAVKNAEVKNVTVENASIGVKTESGEVYAAVLAGYSDASDIAYCLFCFSNSFCIQILRCHKHF